MSDLWLDTIAASPVIWFRNFFSLNQIFKLCCIPCKVCWVSILNYVFGLEHSCVVYIHVMWRQVMLQLSITLHRTPDSTWDGPKHGALRQQGFPFNSNKTTAVNFTNLLGRTVVLCYLRPTGPENQSATNKCNKHWICICIHSLVSGILLTCKWNCIKH